MRSGGIALLVLLPALAPVTAFSWWDPSTWDEPFQPPAPTSYAGDADLSQVLGKVQLTEVTGITRLTVVDFDQMAVVLEPGSQLTIRQIPKAEYAEGHPVQTTTINATSTLKIVSSAFYTWYAGSEAQPAAARTDPSYIFRQSVPRVSVMNPVPLENLRPTSVVGGATMTTQVFDYFAQPTNLRSNPLVLTMLDVDSVLRLTDVTPTYEVGTATPAATQPGMKSMLDDSGVSGPTLTGVLTSLGSGSAPPLGSVNSDAVATALSTRGFTLQKVTDASLPSEVVYVPRIQRIDLVNPEGLHGKFVFIPTSELMDVSEDRVVGLKDADGGQPTQVLAFFDSQDPAGGFCFCSARLALTPEAGGITDAYAALLGSTRHMDHVDALISIDPGAAGPFHPPSLPGLPENTQKVYFTDGTEGVNEDGLSSLLGPTPSVPPPGFDLATLFANTLYLGDPLDDASLKETLENFREDPIWQQGLTLHIPPVPKGVTDNELDVFLGQLETFVPRHEIPAPPASPMSLGAPPSSDAPPPTGLDAVDGFVGFVHEEAVRQRLDDIHSTIQLRTVTKSHAPVSGAHVTLNVFVPGFKGNSVQSFEGETNGFGYVSFQVLPNALYNFTALKDGFAAAAGIGDTGGPGETSGKEVQMTPLEAWQSALERLAASPFAVALSLAAVAAAAWYWLRHRKRRGRRPGRKAFPMGRRFP